MINIYLAYLLSPSSVSFDISSTSSGSSADEYSSTDGVRGSSTFATKLSLLNKQRKLVFNLRELVFL
jgi:hypothetical protein